MKYVAWAQGTKYEISDASMGSLCGFILLSIWKKRVRGSCCSGRTCGLSTGRPQDPRSAALRPTSGGLTMSFSHSLGFIVVSTHRSRDSFPITYLRLSVSLSCLLPIPNQSSCAIEHPNCIDLIPIKRDSYLLRHRQASIVVH